MNEHVIKISYLELVLFYLLKNQNYQHQPGHDDLMLIFFLSIVTNLYKNFLKKRLGL